MKRKMRLLFGPALIPVLVSLSLFGGQSQTASPAGVIKNKIIQRELNFELGKAQRPKWAQKVSSGVMYNALLASGAIEARLANAKSSSPAVGMSTADTEGCPKTFPGGIGGSNVRVNQDCSLRRQAEEAIAVNPTNRKNLIVGQNDSRLGFNQCGFDWSFDGGVHWGDQVPPFHQVFLGNGHVGDFCSDPTVAWDTDGNAYAGGLEISIDFLADAVLVAKSNAGIGGAFYHSPDSSQAFQTYLDSPLGVVDSVFDETGCTFDDKELMTVDQSDADSNGNVYMVWTLFRCTDFGVLFDSPIMFGMSTDGGFTWSTATEISGFNSSFCTDFSGESDPNACDQDQGGHPIVGPDGTIYVGFGNGNTPTFGLNQHMVVSCNPNTTDCTDGSNWSAPSKIGDDFGVQPIENDGTNLVTGCPGGRQCLPPNGYRLDDFVEGSISADSLGGLYFVWADGRNIGPPCDTLDYDTAAPPCNNDVFFSFSTDGGATWSSTFLVTANGGDTAQWMPWSAVAPGGKTLWIGYYTRQYGGCEFSGCNDIVLAKVKNPRGPNTTITYTRLTTASMPNLVVANNPVQAGFLGDYMWVAVDHHGTPYVVWADTRGRGQAGVVEEDIYFAQ